jgi:hypothetical protein
MQAADDPPVTQAQALPAAAAAAEVCCCQVLPLLIIHLFQLEQDKFPGIPELVAKVTVGIDSVQRQVQVLACCCACGGQSL